MAFSIVIFHVRIIANQGLNNESGAIFWQLFAFPFGEDVKKDRPPYSRRPEGTNDTAFT